MWFRDGAVPRPVWWEGPDGSRVLLWHTDTYRDANFYRKSGEHDGVLPLAMADLAQRMPQCKLEVIPGAGHLPNVEHPASFNAALRRALDGS